LIAQLFLGLFYHYFLLLSLLASIIFKFIFEFRILYKGKKILFNNLQLKYLFVAEIFQIPYIIFTGLVGAFGNYSWKARKVKR